MPDYPVKSTEYVYDYKIRTGNKEQKMRIDRTTMDIPTGKMRGALPRYILINGVEWDVIRTGIIAGRTYDKIKNMETGEKKTYERGVLLDFLKKNWAAWQKKMQKEIVNKNNSYTFEQSEERKQNQIEFPELDF